jgi:hypothetical protein
MKLICTAYPNGNVIFHKNSFRGAGSPCKQQQPERAKTHAEIIIEIETNTNTKKHYESERK